MKPATILIPKQSPSEHDPIECDFDPQGVLCLMQDGDDSQADCVLLSNRQARALRDWLNERLA